VEETAHQLIEERIAEREAEEGGDWHGPSHTSMNRWQALNAARD
jgi:hypothetical protein